MSSEKEAIWRKRKLLNEIKIRDDIGNLAWGGFSFSRRKNPDVTASSERKDEERTTGKDCFKSPESLLGSTTQLSCPVGADSPVVAGCVSPLEDALGA